MQLQCVWSRDAMKTISPFCAVGGLFIVLGCAEHSIPTPLSIESQITARHPSPVKTANQENDMEKAKSSPEILFPALQAGFYSSGDPKLDALEDELQNQDFSVDLSWHNGISFFRGTWRHQCSLADVCMFASEPIRKNLAVIQLEKNYNESGPDATDRKVMSILQEMGYRVIVVQTGHSMGVWINEVRRAPFDNAAIQSVESETNESESIEGDQIPARDPDERPLLR